MTVAEIVNAFPVAPTARVARLKGPSRRGKAPPVVLLTGEMLADTIACGKITVRITAGGALGTATYALDLNDTLAFAGGATAAVVPISTPPLTIYFQSGTYDTSNEYVWTASNLPRSFLAGDVVAVGMQALDYLGDATLLSSTLARVHGAHTITMPSDPWDGMRCAVMDADGIALSSNEILVDANSGQAIQHPLNPTRYLSAAALAFPYQCVEWAWDAVAGHWRIVADNKADALPLITAGSGTTSLFGRCRVRVNTSSAAATIVTPTSPYDDMVIIVKDIGGAAATHNITVTASGSQAIEPPTGSTPSAPGGNASMSTAWQAVTWRYDASSAIWRADAVN